jgi:hypothetical protein
VLDALLTKALLILSLEVGVNLGALGGSVAVDLGLEESIRLAIANDGMRKSI